MIYTWIHTYIHTIQYNTIQYNTIQYNTIRYNTIHNTQYNTIQYNTIQYNTIQYNTIQYNTIQYNTIQYNTIQYNTIQYNTIQYNTIHTYIHEYMYIHTWNSKNSQFFLWLFQLDGEPNRYNKNGWERVPGTFIQDTYLPGRYQVGPMFFQRPPWRRSILPL